MEAGATSSSDDDNRFIDSPCDFCSCERFCFCNAAPAKRNTPRGYLQFIGTFHKKTKKKTFSVTIQSLDKKDTSVDTSLVPWYHSELEKDEEMVWTGSYFWNKF